MIQEHTHSLTGYILSVLLSQHRVVVRTLDLDLGTSLLSLPNLSVSSVTKHITEPSRIHLSLLICQVLTT